MSYLEQPQLLIMMVGASIATKHRDLDPNLQLKPPIGRSKRFTNFLYFVFWYLPSTGQRIDTHRTWKTRSTTAIQVTAKYLSHE